MTYHARQTSIISEVLWLGKKLRDLTDFDILEMHPTPVNIHYGLIKTRTFDRWNPISQP
jgi:hypothetical protein